MAIGFDPSTAIQALNDKDESFDEWKLKNAPEDTGEDYDLAGAFNANLHPAENGHFPDTFKKPNHPTFSKDSIYSTEDQTGGEWGTDDQGRDTFKPSPWMGSDPARHENLKSYFKEKEPNATLIDPDPYEKPFDPSTAIPREEFIDKLVKDGTFDPANYKNFGVSKEDAFEVRQKKKDRTLVEKTKAFASGISGSTFAEAAKGVAKFIGGLAVMIGDANIQAIAPQVSRVLKGLGYNALAKNVDNELLSERRELALGASHGEEAVKSLGRNIGEFAGDISHWVSGGPRDDAKERADFDEDIAAADREKQLHEGKFIKGSIVGKIAKAGSDMFGEGKDIESTLGAKHLEEEGARKANELTVEMLSAGMDPVNIALMLSSVATGGASSIAGKAATALAEAGVAGRVASGVIRGAMATSSGIAYIPKLVANTATRTLGAAASFPFKIIRAIPSRLGRITRIGETGITAGLAAEAAMHPALVAKAAGIAAIARVLDLMGKGLSAAGETTGKFGVTNLDQQILTGFRAGESNLLLKGSRALGQGVHKFIEVPIEFAPFNLASSGGDPNKFADMSIGAGMFGGIFATKAQFRSSAQKALNANAHGVRMIEHGAKNLGEVHPEIFAMHQANLFMFSDQIREEIQKCRSLSNGGLATDVLVLSPEQCNIIRADKAKYKIDIPEKFDTQCAVHLTEQGKILINTGRFGLVDGKIENFGGGVRNQAQYHEIGHAVLESIRKGVETAHGQSVIEMLKHSMSPEEQKKAATDYLNALYPKGIPALEIAKLEATPDLHLDESLSEISRSLLRGQDLARYGFSQESNRIITKKLGKILHGIARTMGMGLTQMDFGSFDMKVDISGERGPQFGQIWNQEEAKAINSILHEVGQRADRKMRGVSTDADREFYQKMREKPPVPPKDPEADPSPEPEPKPKGPEPEPEPIPKPEPEPEPIPKPEPILKFNADDYYENGGFYYPKDMKFGDLPPQGWKAHISATPENMENVLNVVLPILNKNNIRHKFTPIERFATKDKTSNLFDKLITIYGKTPEETARILQEIDSALLSKNLTEARWKDSPENRWGKSGMISYRFGEFLGWGDTNHPTLGKVKDGFIVDEKNGKIIWDDRKNNNQVDDDLLPLLNKIPKPKPTPEPIPKVGHLTQQEIFDAAKSDPANPIGAVIDAHKRNEEDHEGGLTVQDHTDARGVPFRTVDGVLIKGDPFSEYLLNQVLVGTERRPLTQEERDIITGLKTGSVNGFVYGHAGYDIASPIIVDVSRRRKIIENPAGERIDNPSRRQNEQKRALFVNAVFNERSRTITLQMLSVDKLNNNYQNLVEAIKIANDRGEHIDNPYTTDADVVVDLKNYAENYKNNWAGDGHQPVRDADGNPLSTIGEPHKIDFDKFNFINLLLANESLKSSTRLASARRRIARANGINLEVDLESNPLRKRLNEIFPKNPETRNSWSEDLFESPHEILRPELIRGINGDIDSKGGLRNVGPEFNEAFDKGIPDENMVAGNYMPKEEDDVEYYFTVSTGRQGAINNLIENGRSAEIPEIIKLVVINAFSDMKSIPMNIEDISGLYKESQQLDPTKEPAVRVSFKYKTEEELNAIRKRFCDLGEIWDQDEIYELTHNDSSKLDIGDQTNTMERIVKSIEINIRNLTEKNILRIAEESGINGLTISNEKILIYDQANEGKEFDRKSDRFRELATEETGMAEEGDVGWVALRKFGRTTDVSKAVTGYQDRIVSDPNIADPFRFRGDLIKRLMMLGRVPDAPKNGKRSYYEKDDLSPIQINRHKVLAKELAEAPDFDPSALDGYDKLCDELVRQYKALTAKLSNQEFDPEGIRFEMDTYHRKDPITGEIISGDLYKSSKEAVNDLFRNKRLRILKTDADAFGPPNSEWGEHPLLRQSGEVDANGQPMTYNDLLRGVHDTIAHSMFSDQFGQIGEEGAWQVHIRTISDVDARRALTAETRSQNSFVNFGSGMQNPDGTILKKGDAGWISPAERPFGPQKVFLPKLENCLTGDKKVDAPVLDAIAERDAQYMPEDSDKNLNSEEIILGDRNVSYMPEWKAGKDSLMEYEGEREQIAAVLRKRFRDGLGNPNLLGPLKKLIEDYPPYLDGPLNHIVKSAERLKLGKIEHRELAKAYIMTIVSQGAGAITLEALQKSLVRYNNKMKKEKGQEIKFKIDPSQIFLGKNKKGKIDVRPEEIAAYWITTEDGKKALDNLDYYAQGLTPKGLEPLEGATEEDFMPARYRPEDFALIKLLRSFYGDDRIAASGMTLGNEWVKDIKGKYVNRQSRPKWATKGSSKATRKDKFGFPIQAKDKKGNLLVNWSKKEKGEVSLSNLSEALEEINKNKGQDVQGMIDIFLRFKGIDSAKAPFIGHFIGFGKRITLDAVEKNYEIGETGDSGDFASDRQLPPYKSNKKNLTVDEKAEVVKERAKIKAANDAVKLPYRKELEVLSGSSELQELAREFIENKIDQIKKERLAKNPNDPIKKIPVEAFYHIMHHWIWDAAKGLNTTHEGLYEAMDPKYMPAEEGSRDMVPLKRGSEHMGLAKEMLDKLANLIPELSPRQIKKVLVVGFDDLMQSKIDKLPPERQLEMDNFFKENETDLYNAGEMLWFEDQLNQLKDNQIPDPIGMSRMSESQQKEYIQSRLAENFVELMIDIEHRTLPKDREIAKITALDRVKKIIKSEYLDDKFYDQIRRQFSSRYGNDAEEMMNWYFPSSKRNPKNFLIKDVEDAPLAIGDRYMPSEEGKSKYRIEGPYDEYGDIDDAASDVLFKMAKDRGVNILRGKELSAVARDRDGKIVGGTFVEMDRENYTFDIVVEKELDGQGIGSRLLDNALNPDPELFEAYPDMQIKAEVTSPIMKKMLEKRGFVVDQKAGESFWVMVPKKRRDASYMPSEEGNLHFDKDSEIKLTDYGSQQILDKLQPNRGEVPKTDRITSGFVNGNTLSENDLYSIQENYSKWARRSGMTPTDLIQHIGNGNASVWSAYGTNDKFVGQFIGDTFVVSHFAPEGGKSAIGGLMDLLHTQTPVVFAVPDRIAGQLERLGFRRSKLVIPMMFKGEVMQKNLLANNAVTGSDTQKLAAWWVAESSLNGLLEKIGGSDLLDSAKEGINQLQLSSKDASYMPFAGESATGFAEAEKKGDVFVNPFDLMKRFEISDDKMESLNAWRKLYNDGDQFDFILGDLYDHPELFKNYPWLKDIPVIVEFKNDNTNASVNYDGTQINVEFGYLKKLIDDVNFNNEKYPTQKMQDRADLKLKKTIIHEIQHLIQFEEKFAMGGNSAASSLADTLNSIKYAKQEALRKAVDKFNRSSSKDERAAIALDVSKMRTDLDLWDQHYKNTYGFSYGQFEPTITKMQLWQLYQSIAGEMESRAAADRSGMTSEDRKKFPVIFDTNYKDNPIVTFRLPSSEKYKSIEDANAKRLGVDRYMPADELADQLGVSGTLPDDMVGKGLSTWMHDLIEAFTKAEKDGNNAKAEEIREYLSSGGAGYALVNKGTGVCWASNYGAVKNLAGMLRSRGTPFRDKIDGDEYCYVAPYTMKGDALVSNVEYANQRIIDIRNWAKTQTPEEIKRFEARVQNWAAKNKQFLYSNFNIKDAKFEKIAGETAESGSFEARKKLMQYLSSEAISKEFNLPSGQYRAYKSIDPAYHGLVEDMETTGAMFHTIILKVNLTKLERATAVQDYRNYQNSVKEGGKKSGSADEKLIILDLVDKGIDVNKTKFVQDYRDYQEAVRSKKKKSGSKEEQQIIKNLLLGGVDESVIAKEKGSKAEEYGVDSHPSYDSIINGDVVAYLRNPVAAKTLRPTVFKNFDKYNADLKAKGYDKPVAYAGLETNYPLRGDMDDVKNVLVVSNAKERAAARQHNAKAKISGEELKEIPEIKWKYSEKFAPTPNQILTQELVDQANALQVTSRVGSEEIPKQTFDEYSKKTKSYRDKNEKAYQKFESSDKQFEQIKAALAYVKSKITAGKNMYKDINADIKEYNDAREEGTPEKEYIYPPEYEDLLNEAQTLNRAISLYESTIQRKKVKNREEKKLAKKSEREPILVPETASVSKWAFRALRIAGERDLTRNKEQTQLLIEEERIRLEEKAKKEADEKAKKEAKKAKKEADEKAKKADEKAKKEANKEANKKSKIQENAEARIEAKS